MLAQRKGDKMRFEKALELMKQGEKLKLPSWGGYWNWDEEKRTILMHLKMEKFWILEKQRE